MYLAVVEITEVRRSSTAEYPSLTDLREHLSCLTRSGDVRVLGVFEVLADGGLLGVDDEFA